MTDLLTNVAEKLSLQREDIVGIGSSSIFWTLLYIGTMQLPIPLKNKYGTLTKQNELDIQNRFVSLIHGTVLAVFAGYAFYFTPGQCGDVNSQYEKNLIYIAVGYFIYDFLCMAYYGLLDSTMILHHTATATGMTFGLVMGKSANMIIGGMFIAEVSNPPMHFRVMLKHLGLRYSKAYETSEITFIMLYTFGRIVLGCYQVWSVC